MSLRKYMKLPFEQKTIIKTVVGLCFSAVLASGKLIIGCLTDYNLCTIAIYTFALLAAKLECVIGVKSGKRLFKIRNFLIAAFLFLSSVFYMGFMCRMLFLERKKNEYGMGYMLILAFISFCELGFAIAGMIRASNKGHFFRDIKIINFCISLIAILTTQMTILDYNGVADADIYNAYTGIGIGGFIALCAVYIAFAPKISIIDREHNIFELKDITKNKLINTESSTAEIILCKSAVYGSYIYRFNIQSGRVDGYIVRGTTLWKRMHVLIKILCCILSEILLFVWLIGRFILMLRSIDTPKKLEKIMLSNGFEKVVY